MPPMTPSRVSGSLTRSSSHSGIFFQGDGQSQNIVNSHLSSSFVNSSSTVPGAGCSNLGPVSGDINNAVLNTVTNSAPSVGASSLVTDANSALSGGPHLQRSASVNTDSYLRLPASPMSFTLNNISISGSSVMDGSSVVQQSSHQDQNVQQLQQNQQQPQGASSATSLPASQTRPSLLQMGAQVPRSFIQDPNNMSHLSKKPRMDIKQEDIMQQQRPYDSGVSGVCARRLMQYLYHQRQRPNDNSIAYWRKFVAEYYSPRAKKRWCLSLYSNVGHHALGVFPQAAMDAWQCDICGSKSGRGFEATYEVLPRLNEIKFGSGVIGELLFLDLPREIRLEESVYEPLHVVREGQLHIIFTQNLKILSWEFYARCHEELLPQRLVAPQVNQLIQVAQKCQSTIAESGADWVSQQDLQTNSNM
ncbi:Transcriptional corepressor SEUSS [Glycine soja]|uniref:Transcriptional corepressor SEUSS n=1 Tax=Glycine soja TaxID=3848 RepID=A0A0B2QU66_GLYSO|nr:Transcriptional corepressor SEUSS [Glycine soja]